MQKSYHLRAQGLGLGDNVYHGGMRMGEGWSGYLGTCDPNGTGTKNTLGFRVEECGKLRYTYVTGGLSALGVGAAANNAGGTPRKYIYPQCDGGGSIDTWSIQAGGELKHNHDIVQDCDN